MTQQKAFGGVIFESDDEIDCISLLILSGNFDQFCLQKIAFQVLVSASELDNCVSKTLFFTASL